MTRESIHSRGLSNVFDGSEHSNPGAVDIWVNPITEDVMKRIDSSIVGETGELFSAEGLFTSASSEPDVFVERLTSLGIEVALLPSMKFGSRNHERDSLEVTETEVQALCSKHPDRLKGLVGLDPFERMDGVRQLEWAVREGGFVGAHLVPYGFNIPPNHRLYYPFYAKCVELDVPVIIQCGHTAVRMSNDPGRPAHIEDIALNFPELDIVAANTGWPWTNELVAIAWTNPNIYIGTTGHAPQYWDEELVEFTRSRGQDKVLWGTNYPVVDMERSLKRLTDLNFTEEVTKKLISENARSVFDL